MSNRKMVIHSQCGVQGIPLSTGAPKPDFTGAYPNNPPADDVNKDGAPKSISTVVQRMTSIVTTVLCRHALLFPTTGVATTKAMLKTFASIVGSNNTYNWNKPF